MEWINDVGYAQKLIPGRGYQYVLSCGANCPTSFEPVADVLGNPMTTIDESAFFGNERIKYFDALPHRDLYIGMNAFAMSKRLQSVHLDGLQNTRVVIYTNAFYCCQKLNELSCNRPLYLSGEKIFAQSSLRKAVLNVKDRIPGATFWCCKNLEEVEFTSTMPLRIAENAFDKCKALKTLTFHSSVRASDSFFEKMKNVHIRCSQYSNLTTLAYSGWDIEIF